MTGHQIQLAYATDTLAACDQLEALLLEAVETHGALEKKRFEQVLHGIKGVAAAIGVSDADALCHAVESLLRHALSRNKEALLFAILDRSVRELADQARALVAGAEPGYTSDYLRALLFFAVDEPFVSEGPRWPLSLGRRLDEDELDSSFQQGLNKRQAKAHVEEVAWESLMSLGPFVHDQSKRLADSLGRDLVTKVDIADCVVPASLLSLLRTQVGHLLKNAIDHGIETREERESEGKRCPAELSFWATKDKDSLELILRDDGRGIDVESLKIAHGQAGGLEETDDLVELLATGGVTTRSSVGKYSGRGLGVGAVKNAIEGIGGWVRMDSLVGCGTTVTLHIPLLS